MLGLERMTDSIYIPLEEGGPSFDTESIQQGLPDWEMSYSEYPRGITTFTNYETAFSRTFEDSEIILKVVRNNGEGDTAVSVEFARGSLDPGDESINGAFHIWKAHSLIVCPFDEGVGKYVMFRGTRGAMNESIQLFNIGLLLASSGMAGDNSRSTFNFKPIKTR